MHIFFLGTFDGNVFTDSIGIYFQDATQRIPNSFASIIDRIQSLCGLVGNHSGLKSFSPHLFEMYFRNILMGNVVNEKTDVVHPVLDNREGLNRKIVNFLLVF